MTVAELIAKLQTMPQDAPIHAFDYRCESLTPVKFAWYTEEPGYEVEEPAVILCPFNLE